MQHYAQLFRDLRLNAKYGVDVLAEKSSVDRTTIHKVERGDSVKITTIVDLMVQMGYPLESAETGSVVAAWVHAQCGVDLTNAEQRRKANQKIVVYSRSVDRAISDFSETVRKSKLREADVRLLSLVAANPDLLAVVRSICDLLPDADADLPQLKAAEDK